ncbi:hypothetical protein DVS77_15285 [Mycolicibacterium moriokaense]|nr:hypothetical protein DVS77_15285 [Mycolicibacterium moriokaense]
MEPVEINAGAWYLRGVQGEAAYRWQVCEPVTGDPVAEVTLDPATATLSSTGDDSEAIETARDAVRRFAAQALGITVAG